MSKGKKMSKKKLKEALDELPTHDKMILNAISWAESLGYEVKDYNLGTEKGPDAVFRNSSGDEVRLEIETGASFIELFERLASKKKIWDELMPAGTYIAVSAPKFLGIIVVGDRINNVRKHAEEAGFAPELFKAPTQKIFAVRASDFKELLPVLLVSLLGSRASK